MTARERLDLMVERLQTGVPIVLRGEPWMWPEGDPVMVSGDVDVRWLPHGGASIEVGG